jgi:hypothetical protein
MQVVQTGRAAKIADFRRMRAQARSAGDAGIARAMDLELAHLGEFETTQAPALETATPAKPRRGRKPLPRCEHNLIASRCPDCADDAA